MLFIIYLWFTFYLIFLKNWKDNEWDMFGNKLPPGQEKGFRARKWGISSFKFNERYKKVNEETAEKRGSKHNRLYSFARVAMAIATDTVA